MSMRFRLKTKKSRIAGIGAFALTDIPKGKKIGEMAGELISYREAQRRVRRQPGGVLLMVEFDNEPIALDASINRNELSYINHSCGPNTYMRRAYRRVEFYSLKKIKKGEELTCDYGETHHDGKLKCGCKSLGCRGYI